MTVLSISSDISTTACHARSCKAASQSSPSRTTLPDGHLFAFVYAADGTPDGVTLDAEDHLWVGLWGGRAARRYAPDGALVDEVRFPCAHVTKLAFGGPDLRTAFATTATLDLDPKSFEEQPPADRLSLPSTCPFPIDRSPPQKV